MVHTNSDSEKREDTNSERAKREKVCHLRDSVYVHNIVIWYCDREGVTFRDSRSEIERNIAKRQIRRTLPERSVGTS